MYVLLYRGKHFHASSSYYQHRMVTLSFVKKTRETNIRSFLVWPFSVMYNFILCKLFYLMQLGTKKLLKEFTDISINYNYTLHMSLCLDLAESLLSNVIWSDVSIDERSKTIWSRYPVNPSLRYRACAQNINTVT